MKADVLVVGGGPAGVAAARAAAERGTKVMLVERYGFLGGSLTASLVGTLGGLFLRNGEEIEYLVGGIARECAETLKERGLAFGPVPWEETAVLPHVPWGVKDLFDEWVSREKNIELHLHTQLVGCDVQDSEIRKVTLLDKSGIAEAEAKIYIDASGDGNLAFQAGAQMEGSPVQFPSMNFYMANVNLGEALAAGLATLQTLIKESIEKGEYDLPRAGGAVIPTMRPGEVIVAMGRIAIDSRPVNCADPEELTYAELEGRRQAKLLAEFLREKMPGFSQAYLLDTPTQVGVRSTRRLVGRHVLTGEEVLEGARFDDAICRSAWPVEMHAEGKGTVLEFLQPGEYYQIPYRSLLPLEINNLLVVGRCLSATPQGQASARVSATSMAMGEAAGVAAELALSQEVNPADVNIPDLQGILGERGSII